MKISMFGNFQCKLFNVLPTNQVLIDLGLVSMDFELTSHSWEIKIFRQFEILQVMSEIKILQSDLSLLVSRRRIQKRFICISAC